MKMTESRLRKIIKEEIVNTKRNMINEAVYEPQSFDSVIASLMDIGRNSKDQSVRDICTVMLGLVRILDKMSNVEINRY
tara:strand:- start:331 stop:567 length:237 start_codon:yes stop_codon:yes gene_type:complete